MATFVPHSTALTGPKESPPSTAAALRRSLMATGNAKTYEELRRQRVEQNLKQLEELGISQISRCLLEVAKFEQKQLKHHGSPKTKKSIEKVEIRRSSRARNMVPSYCDQVDETEIRSHRKRYCRSDQRGRMYSGRIPSYEEQLSAVEKAKEIQNNLNSVYPSFIKSMGLPAWFCKDHLPPNELKMVLEDEDGKDYDAIYIGNRTGLSGGWRGFAMDHNLEDGDVLVFELRKPATFKIHIIKAIDNEDHKDKVRIRDTEEISPEVESAELSASQKRTTKSGSKRKPAKTKKSAYC